MAKSDVMVKTPCPECGGAGYLMVSKLSALRKNAGLDQQEAADRLGLTRTSISNIERGIQAISVDKISVFADMYGVDEFEMYKVAKALAKDPMKENHNGN